MRSFVLYRMRYLCRYGFGVGLSVWVVYRVCGGNCNGCWVCGMGNFREWRFEMENQGHKFEIKKFDEIEDFDRYVIHSILRMENWGWLIEGDKEEYDKIMKGFLSILGIFDLERLEELTERFREFLVFAFKLKDKSELTRLNLEKNKKREIEELFMKMCEFSGMRILDMHNEQELLKASIDILELFGFKLDDMLSEEKQNKKEKEKLEFVLSVSRLNAHFFSSDGHMERHVLHVLQKASEEVGRLWNKLEDGENGMLKSVQEKLRKFNKGNFVDWIIRGKDLAEMVGGLWG